MAFKMSAPGYNRPTCLAMFIAQWAHQFFLWDWITFEVYQNISDKAYEKFPSTKAR